MWVPSSVHDGAGEADSYVLSLANDVQDGNRRGTESGILLMAEPLQERMEQVERTEVMKAFPRITFDPAVMGGKPCIRGLRVTVSTIVGLLAAGRSAEEILEAYPYLEREDIDQSLAYAAWRLEEREVPLSVSLRP